MSGFIDNFYKSDPIVAFNYVLRVEGLYDIPCKSVRAFSKKNAYEHIQQGGLNDHVILKRKPITEPFTFQIERYTSNSVTDPLANGAELTLPIFLQVLKQPDKGFMDNETSRVYVFTGCVVTEKEYGELNAEKPGLQTEIVTIAYNELYVVPGLFSLGGM